ncbi:MAG: ribonuclease T, partial [Rhodospirillaceae bacterium]
MKHAVAAIVSGLLLLLPMTAANAGNAKPWDFQYYVLSLSWSPQYCATSGEKKNDPQCAGDRRYGFVLHGLWPHYAEGGWPEFCTTPAAPVSEAIIAKMLPIEPSRSLI